MSTLTQSFVSMLGRRMRAEAWPARVLQELEHEQYRSELLVTAVQLLIAAVLAVLYAFTPPGFSPDAPIRAVPLGLTLFSVVALIRLYLAVTGQLQRWMVGATVVTEMALLMFVIWAYHLQYEQPAPFSLKCTEFAYVFILIALRTLRFEPIWVLLSGLTAAAGWLALLAYALTHAQGNAVTWDYVTSLRSTQIHFGGELDKVLAIVVTTAVLAMALARARRFVILSVSGRQAVTDLSMFFDDPVADRITRSEVPAMPGQADIREATIVFFDMRGFTEASRTLCVTDLIALLREYQQLIVPIIRSHGGSIDKFLGDGILASFGAVIPDTRHAANALRAVDAVMHAVDGWRATRSRSGQQAPDIGAGIASGPVLFGIVGDGKRLEYTVIGDAVNLAAKLEKHNKAESTRAMAPHATYAQAIAQGYAKTRPTRSARSVAGVTGPVDVAVWMS
ncbi:adenylate/guanylate cyclase domain-containing protein [Paraburkholderia sp. CNPSo 3157]|uniref:Adenylate/guanylate cyclase domain-containing protein n=1 Tax=Paraburkholderia franconis TaxID=2654983 RepID=A0A7X1NJ40_9BURK|nr:adenylate/guanylate cyclase domain-containing protein [Paraburkholderia franconis]MPW22910.1 adenylate/guanylate cyclase domain-containing protein [Paraburkholderia franconis]